MSDFITSFTKSIGKLYRAQMADPPAVILQLLSKIGRFGLLALCIFAGVLLVAFILALCNKKQRLTAVPIGIVCLLVTGLSVWAFLPVSAAAPQAVESGAVQSVEYIEAAVLAAQAEADSSDVTADPQAAADSDVQPEQAAGDTTTGDANSDTSASDSEEDAAPELTGLARSVTGQTELTDAQLAQIEQVLTGAQCRRTLRMSLPQVSAKNVLLRLENGKRWQVLLLQDGGYLYAAEDADFIYRILDYNAFYKQMQTALAA